VPPTGPSATSLRRQIDAADRAILTRVAATDSVFLDQVMPRLSRAANHGVLWIAIAAGLAATRRLRARRAALRGLAGHQGFGCCGHSPGAAVAAGSSPTGGCRPCSAKCS